MAGMEMPKSWLLIHTQGHDIGTTLDMGEYWEDAQEEAACSRGAQHEGTWTGAVEKCAKESMAGIERL